ncbi:MAG: UvrD-helicase domain-containing protein [Chromatiales bacterium]|nr:UvrD-helicase domain-containing protein [Chromatiales bacterium]
MKSALKLLSPEVSGIVYASAGTGKTWLLISRLLRLLLDQVNPSSILAITFTNKAADEMRDRVAERIFEWSTQSPKQLEASLKEIGITDVQKYRVVAPGLYEQLLHATDQMQITTFHAFCQKLISLCPLQSNVPLDFQIAENATEWQSKAVDILFSRTTLADKKIAAALDLLYAQTHSLNNVRTILSAFLDRHNDWLNYISDRVDGADQATLRLYKQLAISETVPVNTIWQDIKASVIDYRALLAEHPTTKNVAHAECLKELTILDELSDDDFVKLNHCIHTTAGQPRQRKLTKTLVKAIGEAEGQQLIALSAKISSAVMRMRESKNRHSNYRLNEAWYIAGHHLLDIYTELKQQHRLLDFNDLEGIASKLLTRDDYGSRWIQYRLASRIEHILIDEFQDTNPTQWQLLQPLMEEIASQKGGSVFIVGDSKQSIYGFRRADPELQVEAGQWLKRRLSGHEASADMSYRSAPPIIDFVNRIFEKNNALPNFKCHQTKRDINGGIRIFDLFEATTDGRSNNTEEWRNPLRKPLLSTTNSHATEAATVAQTIALLHQHQLAIAGTDGYRPIEYSDILIVARQKTHFDVFTRALRQRRIPVMSTHNAGLLSRLEVIDMLQLLAALNNPYDDLALAQVLRSPIYALSDQHLLELSSQEGSHYFTKLMHAASQGKLWSGIYNDIKEWSAQCARLPIHDLLYTIYEQQNLISRYRASVHAEEREQVQLHLEAFLEYVLDYDSGRYPDIARFLDHVHLAQGREEPLPQEQNCVRMMSIHGAKGLEAAVVFMVDCAFKLPNKETYDVLVDWPAYSRNPKHFILMPPTAERSELLSELTATRRLRNQKEEINLLYVALTRAKQYLFISGSGKSKSDGHWYSLIEQLCCAQKTFGDDPLKQIKDQYTTNRQTATATESSVDLKLFSDAVLANTQQRQIEPSQLVENVNTPTLASASADARLRGVIIHRALELLNRQSYADYRSFQQAFTAYTGVSDEMSNACTEEAWLLMQNPALKELFDETRYSKSYYEMPLLYADDKAQIVCGKVDQLCVSKDQVWLIDYKTNRLPEHNRDSFYQQLAARYLPQMQCYREGVAKLFPNKTIRLSLLFTKSGFLYDYPSLENSICSSKSSGAT